MEPKYFAFRFGDWAPKIHHLRIWIPRVPEKISLPKIQKLLPHPPETNSKFTPENGWLEYDCFLLGWLIFGGKLLVSGSVHPGKLTLF